MNPCFKTLHAFMRNHDACTAAFAAVESAADWDELCAHPQAGEWAVWMAERLPALAPLLADYEAQEAPLWAGYAAKRAPLFADYEAQEAPLWAECEAKRSSLWAEYEAQEAPLRAEYEAKRDPLLAEYEAAVAPLQVPLIASVRKEFEPAGG